MSFTSFQFIFLFMPMCYAVFYLIEPMAKRLARIRTEIHPTSRKNGGGTARKTALLLASCIFILLIDRRTILVLAPFVLIGFALKSIIVATKDKRCSRIILGLSVALTLAPLLVCKYTGFFGSVLHAEITWQEKLIVPLGISFFTFKQIMVLVECYRNCDFEIGLLDYAIYILFFPQITSGPIEQPHSFLEWLQSDKMGLRDFDKITPGLIRFAIGMIKKVLVADVLAAIVDVCFVERTEVNSTMALFAIVGYSLQIYFDFSAYSDMAIGVAGLLGFSSCENFESPYRSRTIGEFWKKWHMSLTSFFTKYIYIPLGGNRKGIVRTCINILIVFAISGLWHGADWKFVLWGLIYGFLLVIERVLGIKPDKMPKVPGRIITFIIVSLLWTLFRANTLEGASSIIKEFLSMNFHPLTEDVSLALSIPELDFLILKCGLSEKIYDFVPYVILIGAYVLTQVRINSINICREKTFVGKGWTVVLIVLAVVATLTFPTSGAKFIYWNF